MLLNLTLIDALIFLFLLFKVFRPPTLSLGDSIHGLLSVTLIITLILGLKVNAQMRELVSGVADLMAVVPGLGSKLLVIIAAWYLMRLIRNRLGNWTEALIDKPKHLSITRFTEIIRAIFLISLLLWILEGFFSDIPSEAPLAVQGVRYLDFLASRI